MMNKVELSRFLVGVGVNFLCSTVFLAAARVLTSASPLSTFVLTFAPLLQGILIAVPLVWAFRLVHGRGRASGLAAGLVAGALLQVGCFIFWYEHWISAYAG